VQTGIHVVLSAHEASSSLPHT